MKPYIYKNKQFALVNVKTVNGVTYNCYRSISNPKEEILVKGNKVKNVNIKKVWKEPNKWL